MLRIKPVVLLLMTLVALPLVAGAIPGPSPEGLELEGIHIGQSFAEVDSLLNLQDHAPVTSEGAQKYTWLPMRDRDDMEALDAGSSPSGRLRKIDLVFRDGRVAEVGASYTSGGLLTRTTTELVERYGEPSSVEAPPESSIVNLEGKSYSLSLEMWTWRWDDATLLVIDEHYSSTDESPEESASQHHLFRFHLAPAPGSFRDIIIRLRLRLFMHKLPLLTAPALLALSSILLAQDSASPRQAATAKAETILLVDVTEQAGIDFHLTSGHPDKLHIPASVPGGTAFLDMDNDGDLDLYLVNAGSRKSEIGEIPRPSNRLFRNDGPGAEGVPRFTDVTAESGTGDTTWGMGVVAADVEGDGDIDLYVTNFGPNKLYLNDGKGRFQEVAGKVGVDDGRMSTGAAFADVDGDGDLDLFVANYVEYDIVAAGATPRMCDWRGLKTFCGPRGIKGAGDSFYRNLGTDDQGVVRFEDASEESGLSDKGGYYGFTPGFEDFDLDGDLDLYLANDVTPNYLYMNDGKGHFKDVASFFQVAFDEHGREQGSMGLTVGDYDGDGKGDILVTNFSHDTHTLYRNRTTYFQDVTFQTGMGYLTLDSLGWGVGHYDFNLDGYRDYFFAHGHVYPQVDGQGLNTGYDQLDMVVLWDGKKFVRAPQVEGLADKRCSRGATFGDVDNDGDVDMVVQHLDDSPSLLLNRTPKEGRHFLQVRLQDGGANSAAVGARVTVHAGDLRLTLTASAGGSHISSSDPRLHFGLGERAKVDRLEVKWPDGTLETVEGIQADALVTIRRGRGVVSRVER